MLTLFTIPKAFSGHVGIIQDNAVGSWIRLGSGCEVILFGDDPGVAEAAARHGARHVRDLQRNRFGTPVLTDVFTRADAMARNPLLCFVNADIILFKDIIVAAQVVADHFLLVSSRFNCRIAGPLPFGPNWDRDLRARVLHDGRMYPAGGSDIFLHPRGLFGAVPSFAIGRGYWDNWLMLRARQRGANLIDATNAVVAVHQEHDYAHVAGVPPDAKDDDLAFAATEEAEQNLALAGGRRRLYTTYDATEVLSADGRLLSTLRPELFFRRAKAWLRRATPLAPAALRRWRRRGTPPKPSRTA
jgi:hypothetical protein